MTRALIAIFSLGWLLPLWLSASFLNGWLHTNLLPSLQGQPTLAENALYLTESRDSLFLAAVWLLAVLIYWTWRLLHDVDSAPHAPFSPK